MRNPKITLSASTIRGALANRYAAPEWATFFEVGNATGWRCNRHADAVTMSLWQSRGLRLHGFEIKVSRSDWKSELKDPAKAESIQRFCDHWWLVVGDRTIIRDGELPPTWGLLAWSSKGLVQVKEAPTLEATEWTRPFIAALLRSASEGVVQKSAVTEMINQQVEKRVKETIARDHDYKIRHYDQLVKEHRELQERVHQFEVASGIRVDAKYEYRLKFKDPKILGEAVRLVLSKGLDTDHLLGLKNSLTAMMKELDTAMEIASQLPDVGGAVFE